jgi:hypothetical protein
MRLTSPGVHASLLALLSSASGCHRIPSAPRPEVSFFWVSSAAAAGAGGLDQTVRTDGPRGGLVVLDSASFRPLVLRSGDTIPGGNSLTEIVQPSFFVISTFQGSRYHPETIRALAEDTLVLANAAASIVDRVSAARSQPMLDLQSSSPDDLPGLAAFVRAVANRARLMGKVRVAVVVPPTDTTSYPTETLARVADLLVIRLSGEHRNGTAPGAPATPEFIARAIGIRSVKIGPNRLVAELSLFGYRWDRNGSARPITFRQAERLVSAESGTFRRDQASRFLTASGRDGWTVWVPDARTIEAMIVAVRRRGVNQIMLAGPEESDPAIRDVVRGLVKR